MAGRRGRSNRGQQFLLHRARASWPTCRIGIERPLDHLNDACRQVRPQIADRRGATAGVRALSFGDCRALDRIAHGQKVVEQDAEAVDVAGRRRRPPPRTSGAR